jgi:hypothetical protein
MTAELATRPIKISGWSLAYDGRSSCPEGCWPPTATSPRRLWSPPQRQAPWRATAALAASIGAALVRVSWTADGPASMLAQSLSFTLTTSVAVAPL